MLPRTRPRERPAGGLLSRRRNCPVVLCRQEDHAAGRQCANQWAAEGASARVSSDPQRQPTPGGDFDWTSPPPGRPRAAGLEYPGMDYRAPQLDSPGRTARCRIELYRAGRAQSGPVQFRTGLSRARPTELRGELIDAPR
ncbi:hypothetical protein FJT64_007328 [Amphibalanus amphitrite]|uniref:Uncharacterized protein n=1 Tax=Amphibalanus amphitrite TaxID=1232801 RepID=A0A6A4VYW6_AMPAM|nr:hypothetical protein FJT64_007328 [Amphibalanus amphitrite]